MIERSNDPRRWTPAEAKKAIAKNKRFWNSPAGRRRKAELEREQRNRKVAPTRFPKLATQRGTKPAMSAAREAETICPSLIR